MNLAQLLLAETKAVIYATALDIAAALGVPTSTWAAGDPTRSLYHIVSQGLESLEQVVALFCASGFLDYATGDWLTLLAAQVFGVARIEATFATCTCTLTNAGGGSYTFEAGDITAKATVSGKTYRNTGTVPITLGPLGTVNTAFQADEPGSEASAGIGEIDDLVTTFLGVTISNTTVATGLDAESDASLRTRCRDKVASLSPNGPADAYSYVSRNPDLTSTSNITRVRVFPDSDTGIVLVYLASPTGVVTSDDRDDAEAAILTWATPLCITPTVLSATASTVNVTYNARVYRSVNKTDTEVKDAIEDALGELFATRPIGGDILDGDPTGKLYISLIIAAIRATFPDQIFHVTVSSPASDVALANNAVAELGLVTGTITFANDP